MFSQIDSDATGSGFILAIPYSRLSETASPWSSNWITLQQEPKQGPELERGTRDEKRALIARHNKQSCREWVSTKAGRPYHLRRWYR